MPQHLLRLEAVNLAGFVYDTPDLSTVRGGGLLLLKAVQDVETHFHFKRVSVGASVGLFRFEADDPAAKVTEVVRFLGEHADYKHATFVVDAEPDAEDDFVANRERLLARNRWRQQRQPTLSVAGLFDPSADGACAKDRVRPGVERVRNPEGAEEYHSRSVYARRRYGRDQKRELYPELTERDVNTSGEFEGIAAPPRATRRWSTPLYYKMAVLYADGNKFSQIMAAHCRTAERLQKWDGFLQTSRNQMLRALLDKAGPDPHWHEDDDLDKPLRLETLLWGGDELVWVVPAWKGFEALRLFFDQTRAWQPPADLGLTAPLTHAAGLVFCSFKSPVQRVKELAEGLAQVCKDVRPKTDAFAVEFLESFDHVGTAEAALLRRAPAATDRTDRLRTMTFAGDHLADLLDGVTAVKSPRLDLPRRKLYRAAGGDSAAGGELDAHLRQRLTADRWDRLRDQLGGPAAWANLWAWWDYVPTAADFPRPEGRP